MVPKPDPPPPLPRAPVGCGWSWRGCWCAPPLAAEENEPEVGNPNFFNF